MELISFKKILPRIYQVIPGLINETFHCVTGFTGSAKSTFAFFMFLFHPYRFCKENKIPLKIIYFALEESYEKAWIRIRSEILRERYDLSLTYYQYLGHHEGRTSAHDKALAEIEPEIEEMKKYIHIIDDVSNPTGMKVKVGELISDLGQRIDGEEFTDSTGKKHKSWSWKWHNPNQKLIIITDHVSLITPEKQDGVRLNTHEAMQLHNDYCRDVYLKKFKAICCNVQQQQVSGDKMITGKVEDYEPTLAKLANNLELARDYTFVWGLFQPERYGIAKYNGIDLAHYKKGFRALFVLKHRDGVDGDRFPIYFKGTANFKEI